MTIIGCSLQLLVLFGLIYRSISSATNNYPIVGVFAHPSNDTHPDCGGSCQYIAASYVKYIESAGARVVPISYYSTYTEIDFMLERLNGFFFPGKHTALISN